MTKDDLKEKAIESIPYVAVFGIAALAVYGITKIVESVSTLFPYTTLFRDRKSVV